MKQKMILVTGGMGFIGSHIVDELVEGGHDVRVLDNLDYQVHNGSIPSYLNPKAEYVFGDIRNREILEKAMEDIEIIIHEASAVGVGQSMYKIEHYVNVNSLGTATLMDVLVNKEHDVKKLIVAASMSSYGEGLYKCHNCGVVNPPLRSLQQMQQKQWELKCPNCGKIVRPIPTKETKIQDVNSVYALTKRDQEEIALLIGRTYGIPSISLRYFNVYGPRQSLSNPYTGVMAIFMSRIKNGNPPIVYEDGLQTRDFISVHDIVNANMLAMKSNAANYEVFNVGTGVPLTIKDVAESILKVLESDVKPQITEKFRKGDVRHCYADISKIRDKLGYKLTVSFEDGMEELIRWSSGQKAEDRFEDANKELMEMGLA